MKIKRGFSILVVLTILACCMAGPVVAAKTDVTPIVSRMDYMPDPNTPDSYTPPVYFSDGSDTTEPAVYHTTVDSAAAELREQLEDRVTSISIGFQSASDDYDKRLEVFYEALEHTGVPTQGDYLAYQHGAFRYGYDGYSSGGIYYITFTYQMTYYTTAAQETQVDTAVDALLDELDVYDASDYEKIRAVYDYMCENITYDHDGLDIFEQNNSYTKIYTAYAALIDGTSVCQGYANLFYRLALELGVDSRIISGIGNGGGHAWNIVELDDLYYDVDATWDASWKQAGLDYEFFLRCNDNFGDHTRDAEFETAEFNTAYPMANADYSHMVGIANGTCGSALNWVLDAEGVLTISGAGAMENCQSDQSLPWQDYRNNIKSVTIENGVTTIGKYAFAFMAGVSDSSLSGGNSLDIEGGFASRGKNNIKTVTIPVSVTSIGDYAFKYCKSLQTVIYGGTKAQWEAIAVGVGNEALLNANVLYIGEIKLSNAAPTLYDNIAMNYKADKINFDNLGITDPYLVVTFHGQETTIRDYTVSEDGKQYIFTFYNIAPNQMDDTLTATIHATYGGKSYEGATLEYSVATYCYRMLSNSAVVNNAEYAELRTLLVDLLNYGAAAQAFTGFTGAKVNERLTAAQKVWGSTGTPTLESKTQTNYATIANPTVSWKSVGLVLEDAVNMRFKFTVPTLENVTLKITSDTNAEGWTIEAKDFLYEESNSRYYVDFGGLHAGQMRECVYVTVYQGDTAISNTLRYTIESYAHKYQNADPVACPGLSDLVKAMMIYGDAAYNFAN